MGFSESQIGRQREGAKEQKKWNCGNDGFQRNSNIQVREGYELQSVLPPDVARHISPESEKMGEEDPENVVKM